jgi:hypothetical protein
MLAPAGASDSEITFVKLHSIAAKQFEILFAKRACAMMSRLLLDVFTNCCTLGSADRKRAITFLPREGTHSNLIMHPAGGNGLYLTKYISEAMRRAKTDQKMNMIGDAADALSNSIRGANDSNKYACRPPRQDGSIIGSGFFVPKTM